MHTRRQIKRTSLLTLLAAVCLAVLVSHAGAQAARTVIKPEDLNQQLINAAIDKAVAALYKEEPNYTFAPEYAFQNYNNFSVRNTVGNHALAAWAMLEAGESYQNAPLYRRINWVLSSDVPLSYDRGMRATMLLQLPPKRWAPWIRRDGFWLTSALTSEGNYSDKWTGGTEKGYGDNANGQYGVLGLWGIEQAGRQTGYSINNSVWQKVDTYWRAAQEKTPGNQPAGWGVYSFASDQTKTQQSQFYSRVSGPMTAGGVAILSITERMLYGDKLDGTKGDGRNMSPELRKGIAWLDQNFSMNDKDEAADRYYYFWTIQRVGIATGYRTFNGVDWYRQLTAQLLNEQAADGSFAGEKGTLLSTGFALLYLAKSHDPLAVLKLRFDTVDADGKVTEGNWNNRPHDMWNFVDYASDQYEVRCSWQIAEPGQPIYELMESPIIYMSTGQDFNLSKEAIANLRAYVDAGGMIVTNSDTRDTYKAYERLAKQLFPEREWVDLPEDHPIFGVHATFTRDRVMKYVTNGVRPLMISFIRDIGEGLQLNQPGRRGAEGFEIMSNVYLYVTGKNPRRTRLENNYVVQHVQNPTKSLPAALITHSGNYEPEPAAMPQLKALLANEQNIDLQLKKVTGSQLTNERIAFLTTLGGGEISDTDAAGIRKWIEAGGTLWVDAAGGGSEAHASAQAMLAKITPNAVPAPASSDNPIVSGANLFGGYDNRRVRYRLFALRTMGPENRPRLQVIMLGDRPAVIYSAEDTTAGLAGLDHWNIFGYTPTHARRLVMNGCILAQGNPAVDASKPQLTFEQARARHEAAERAAAEAAKQPPVEMPAAPGPGLDLPGSPLGF
jgi:hypothetical protein